MVQEKILLYAGALTLLFCLGYAVTTSVYPNGNKKVVCAVTPHPLKPGKYQFIQTIEGNKKEIERELNLLRLKYHVVIGINYCFSPYVE